MVGGNHGTPLSFLHRHVEPKIPPIPTLVFRARHELHNFPQSLLYPRCECARAKMHNLSTGNFILLVKVVIPCKHRHQRLTAIHDLRPNKISQCYHVIWRELVEMDFKALQGFGNESVRRQSKTSGEERFKEYQLTL